jgi:hypothetical protein
MEPLDRVEYFSNPWAWPRLDFDTLVSGARRGGPSNHMKSAQSAIHQIPTYTLFDLLTYLCADLLTYSPSDVDWIWGGSGVAGRGRAWQSG